MRGEREKEDKFLFFLFGGGRARTQVHLGEKIVHRVPKEGSAQRACLNVHERAPWKDCLRDHSSFSALLVWRLEETDGLI